MKKVIQIIGLTIVVVFLSFNISRAAGFLVPSQDSENRSVTQTKEINDNLFVLGDDIKINAPVNGDLIGVGNKITINAPVSGNVFFTGGEVVVNSTISRDSFLATKQLTLKDNGLIAGSLYTVSQNINNVNSSTVLGKRVVHRQSQTPDQQIRPFLAALSFIVMLITGLVLLKLFPNSHNNLVKITKKDWGKSLLVGVVSIILIPIISALLIVSIIGIPFAVVLLIFLALALYLGLILISYLIGHLIFRGKLNKYLTFTLGLILLKLIETATLINIITPILSIFGLGLFMNIELKAYRLIKDKI